MIGCMCVYIYIYPNMFHHIKYVKLTFQIQSDIDVPRNNFRAGTVAQYNIFLRMCEVTTHIHHGYVSLSLIYITSESTIYGEFHTILWSKINTKFQLQVSPVQNLQRRSPLRCSTCSRFNLSSSTSSTRSTVPSGDPVQQLSLSSRLQRRFTLNSVSLLGDICSLCGKFLIGVTRIQGLTQNAFASCEQPSPFPVPEICSTYPS